MITAESRSIRAYDGPRAAGYRTMMKMAGYGSYGHVLDAVGSALRLNSLPENAVLIDLGCGTGNLSLHLLRAFPRAGIIGVDGSESMLKKARARLGAKAPGFFRRDFGLAGWPRGLPAADAVVSSGAIHHLPGRRKLVLFRRIHSLLKPGGIFVNGDIIRGADPGQRKRYEDFWTGLIAEGIERSTGTRQDKEKVRARHLEIQENEGDSPSTLDEQLAWLREAGFTAVDCHWKLFGFAVFGGVKRG